MANFDVTIKISQEDVAALKQQGYSLYGFKSVEASGSGEPTVWFSYPKNKLLTNTIVEWEETFEGYNSTSQVIENGKITANNTEHTDIGHLLTIEKNSGNLSDSTNGLDGAISFLNLDTQQFTVGIAQVVDGNSNILCAFPILGSGSARAITPITKIALIFSTAQIETATVVTKAMSSGALIDLTGTDSRTVEFSMNNGWTANSASWLSTFNAFEDMSGLLIESPSGGADKMLAERHA